MKSYEGIVDDWIWYISFISLSLHVSTHVNTQVSEPGIVGTVNSMLIQIHVDIAMSNRTCQEALSLDEVRLLHLDGFLTVWLLHASCDPGFCLPWAPKPVVLLDWQEHDKWDALKLMFRRERESLEKLREDKARSWLICSSAHTGLPIVYIYIYVSTISLVFSCLFRSFEHIDKLQHFGSTSRPKNRLDWRTSRFGLKFDQTWPVERLVFWLRCV